MSTQQMLQRIHEQRNRDIEAQRAIVATALQEDRTVLTGEERSQVEKLDQAIATADTEIRLWTDRITREKEADEARSQYEKVLRPERVAESFDDNLGKAEKRNDPMAQFLAGERRSVTINIAGAAREKEMVRQGASLEEARSELRDITKSGDASLIPTNYARTLYDYMETYSGVRRTGATVLTTADGNTITLPKVNTHSAAAAAVAEGGTLAEADPDFTTFSLTAWKFGKLVQVSSELARDTMVDVMSFLAQDSGRALGKATGAQYILGDGTTEPEGVIVGFSSGHTSVNTGSGGVPQYSDFIDLMYSLGDEAYRTNAVWLTKDANVADIRKIVDADGRPLWEPSLKVGEPDVFLGHRVITDTNVADFATSAKGIAFGDFGAGFVIRDVGAIRFERSDDFAFDSDLITFRAIIFSDSAVRDGNAVKVMTSAAT